MGKIFSKIEKVMTDFSILEKIFLKIENLMCVFRAYINRSQSIKPVACPCQFGFCAQFHGYIHHYRVVQWSPMTSVHTFHSSNYIPQLGLIQQSWECFPTHFACLKHLRCVMIINRTPWTKEVSWCSWLSRQSNTLKVSGSNPGDAIVQFNMHCFWLQNCV